MNFGFKLAPVVANLQKTHSQHVVYILLLTGVRIYLCGKQVTHLPYCQLVTSAVICTLFRQIRGYYIVRGIFVEHRTFISMLSVSANYQSKVLFVAVVEK